MWMYRGIISRRGSRCKLFCVAVNSSELSLWRRWGIFLSRKKMGWFVRFINSRYTIPDCLQDVDMFLSNATQTQTMAKF